MTITFQAKKNFGRLDYIPLDDAAKALGAIRGKSLRQSDIETLQKAGFELTIRPAI